MYNKIVASCDSCQSRVAAGEGWLVRQGGRWRVLHRDRERCQRLREIARPKEKP